MGKGIGDDFITPRRWRDMAIRLVDEKVDSLTLGRDWMTITALYSLAPGFTLCEQTREKYASGKKNRDIISYM